MTLVEVMVALLVIGLVLSAFATVILSSLRAIVVNEREVRATSLAQEGIEALQSIEWTAAGIYEGEATAAGATWSDFLGELEGDPVYLAQYTQPDERLPQVPQPVRVYEQANVEYTLLSFVTWGDSAGTEDIKRFTAIVTWENAAGRQRQLRAEATRVPSEAEAPTTNTGARVLAFTTTPEPATLSNPGAHNVETLRVRIRTNQAIAATPAPAIQYYTLGDDHNDWVLRTRLLTGSEGNTLWTTTIPSDHNHHRWTNGFVDVLFSGNDTGGNLLEAWGSFRFTGGPLDGPAPKPSSSEDDGESFPFAPSPADPGDEPDPEEPYPSDPVAITSVLPQGTICVNNSNWAIRNHYKVSIQVSGMRSVDNVLVGYHSYDQKNGAMRWTTQDAAFISGSTTNATFEMLIAPGQRFFSPGSNVDFEAKASRSDGSNETKISSKVSVSASC
jgi:type II secretory pathway pseudopilin PulG